MMSEIVYQYQQAYVPNNGNTFHFWVDCTKEIHDEEAREGGTVRTLYTAPPAPVLRVPAGWKLVPVEPTKEMWDAYYDAPDDIDSEWHAMLMAAPEASNER